jgi:hypothetical protein
LLAALHQAWSPASSRHWRPDNPALGQCDVTALVVQDWLGGEVLKTPLPAGWHVHNRIADRRPDLTAAQSTAPIRYADLPSRRGEAFAGTLPGQCPALAARLLQALAAAAVPIPA